MEGEKELVEDQLVQEKVLEEKVAKLRIQPGLNDPKSLEVVFELFSVWIGLYRLNKTDQLLQEVLPFCEQLGGTWHIKGIQMLGFCRWKQYRYADALELFHKMEGLVGSSAALCENIGHTYSSMGNLDKAEKYFTDALELSRKEKDDRGAEAEGNTGGILLGLGLIKDRQNKVAESLPVLQQALEWYQNKFGAVAASLVAKAHMSVGKAHEKLDALAEAEHHFREALRIFIVTCGDDSPLSAGAMASLGKVLFRMQQLSEAQKHLKGAVALEATKDSVHLQTVFELLTIIMELHTKDAKHLDRSEFKQYVPIIRDATENMRIQGQPEDGDYGAFCKSAGEFCALAASYQEAEGYLTKAIELFSKVTEIDCTHLTQTCNALLVFVQSQSRS
uniref:MalT-like TPR region domain-containing protein n=1 Tax=Eutreptiella gymnastica TaxID=73025 RepID=A0A7S1NH83_9EUGL|mmetsp:Transcript_34920/g.62400  ORF Transcript_34920/g.62400 Transcript_34920/m.62400 type:complete len:390 (+) Transcript_34920:26-1195(+)